MAEVAQAEAPQTDAPPTEAPAVEVQDAKLPPAVDRGTKTPPGQIDILQLK